MSSVDLRMSIHQADICIMSMQAYATRWGSCTITASRAHAEEKAGLAGTHELLGSERLYQLNDIEQTNKYTTLDQAE